MKKCKALNDIWFTNIHTNNEFVLYSLDEVKRQNSENGEFLKKCVPTLSEEHGNVVGFALKFSRLSEYQDLPEFLPVYENEVEFIEDEE